jgi:hypothetical protein
MEFMDSVRSVELVWQVMTDTTDHLNVNWLHVQGATALHEACQEGNVSVAELLIAHGADMTTTTTTKVTDVNFAESSVKLALLTGKQNCFRTIG